MNFWFENWSQEGTWLVKVFPSKVAWRVLKVKDVCFLFGWNFHTFRNVDDLELIQEVIKFNNKLRPGFHTPSAAFSFALSLSFCEITWFLQRFIFSVGKLCSMGFLLIWPLRDVGSH